MLTTTDLQRILVSGVGALLLSATFVGAAIAPARADAPAAPSHPIAARVPLR